MEGLYGAYRKRLRSVSALDFDDLIAGTVRLLATREDVLSACRGRFTHILVDEYQDINFAQYYLLRLLAPGGTDGDRAGGDGDGQNAVSESPSLWVIGDPNQAIYGFRGSDKRFMDRFAVDYPGAEVFRLSKSFRCAAPIIRAAGKLVQAELSGSGRSVSFFRYEYPTEKSEAEGIARRIAALIGGTSFFAFDSNIVEEESSLGPDDCAVLIRTGALASPIIKAFKDHGIPFTLSNERPWWEEEPAKTITACLKGIYGGGDGIPADGDGALPANGDRAPSSGPLPASLSAQVKGETPAGALKLVWDAVKQPAGGPAACVERLFSLAGHYRDIPSMLDALALGSQAVPDIKTGGVRIMTIHAAKGLEFNRVFIAGLEEGLLPFTLYDKPGGEGADRDRLDEERRILYVAMTRAEQGLYLSWARSRDFNGRMLKAGMSRFLAELETLIPLERDLKPRQRNSQGELF
jgi:superfamily I DNA/RNA helicase